MRTFGTDWKDTLTFLYVRVAKRFVYNHFSLNQTFSLLPTLTYINIQNPYILIIFTLIIEPFSLYLIFSPTIPLPSIEMIHLENEVSMKNDCVCVCVNNQA